MFIVTFHWKEIQFHNTYFKSYENLHFFKLLLERKVSRKMFTFMIKLSTNISNFSRFFFRSIQRPDQYKGFDINIDLCVCQMNVIYKENNIRFPLKRNRECNMPHQNTSRTLWWKHHPLFLLRDDISDKWHWSENNTLSRKLLRKKIDFFQR